MAELGEGKQNHSSDCELFSSFITLIWPVHCLSNREKILTKDLAKKQKKKDDEAHFTLSRQHYEERERKLML